MQTSFKRTYASTPWLPVLLQLMPLTPEQATADPCLHQRLLKTHRQVRFSLLWGHCSFLLAPGPHKALFVPSKSLFPHSCGSFVINFHWPSKSSSLGILRSLAGFPGGEICCGPQKFAILQELLWHNCSPVCGSSAQQLYSEVNGNLLQEDLCLMPHFPALLQPDSLSPWQVTADLCLHRGHSYTQSQIWLSLLWRSLPRSLGLVCTRFCLHPLRISGGSKICF